MQSRTNNRRDTDIVLNCRVPVRPAQALLCDVSDTGCRIEIFEGIIRKGSTIFFEVDAANDIAGQVVWVEGNEAGVRFTHKLNPIARAALEL